MVHSVYSDRDIFVRELVSNAADACEKLRYEAIAKPELIEDGEPFAHRDRARSRTPRRSTFSDNGVGMTREDLVDALGTIARSGTKAFLDKLAAEDADKEAGQPDRPVRHRLLFVVHGRRRGRRRDPPRRNRGSVALDVGRQGRLTPSRRSPLDEAPARGTRVILHLNEDSREIPRALPASSASCASIRAPSPCRSTSSTSRAPSRAASPTARRSGPSRRSRGHAGGIHRVLSQPVGPVRRAGADRALARRGAARIYRARLRARLAAVRPVRSGAQGPQQALCAARADHRRTPTCCRAGCASSGWSSTAPTCRSTSRAR